MTDPGRRRLDRILDRGYLSDVEDKPTPQLRAMLAEAREEEDELSYARRLLHGNLDILRSELERRQAGEERSERGRLVERLTSVLAQGAGGSRGARTRVSTPPETPGRRTEERTLGEVYLAKVPDMSEEELDEVIERLVTDEQRVSEQRRDVHSVIDGLEAELVRRYRSGSMSWADLLGGEGETSGGE